jgi:ABC-type protease/lipase transport system fused ATPase/permease subunit
MPWILLLLAIAFFLVPFLTTSVGLGVLCVVLALVFLLLGMMTLISSRMQDNSRNDAQILSAEELRALRQNAEAQKQAAGAVPDRPPNAGEPPG